MTTAYRTLSVASAAWPLHLFHGGRLHQVDIAYRSWGKPDAMRANAILLCHSFSEDALAAGSDPHAGPDRRPWRQGGSGWWDALIGPGRALDTDRYWIICSDVLGGSGGSTGPRSLHPATGLAWGDLFPAIAVADIVAAQRRLLSQLGVERIRLVAGGSLGGLQALLWGLSGDRRVEAVAVVAAAHRISPSGSQHLQSAQAAIRAELAAGGDGMAALLRAQAADFRYSGPAGGGAAAPPEPAQRPAQRFHPVSYLRLADAILHFDAGEESGAGSLGQAAAIARARFRLIGYLDDPLFTAAQGQALEQALRQGGADALWSGLAGGHGHDSFLHSPLHLDPVFRHLLADGAPAARRAI